MDTEAEQIEKLLRQFTPACRETLGLATASLHSQGHELAHSLLRPLAEGRGPLTPEKIATGKNKGMNDPEKVTALMEHRLSLLGGYPEQDLGREIDWFRSPQGDMQWTSHLHYQYWLEPLAYAWHETKDPNYSGELVAILNDWIRKFPLGAKSLKWGPLNSLAPDIPATAEGNFPDYHGPWISLQAHTRADFWTLFFQLIWDAPQMTNANVAVLLNSLMIDHRLMMLNFDRSHTSNQFAAVANTLVHLSWWYPDFACAARTEEVGRDRILHFAKTQVYPDGGAAECSPNYAIASLGRLFDLMVEGKQRGCPFPTELRDRVRLGMRYFALIADPSGCSPRIAKGGESVRDVLNRLNQEFHDPEVAFVASAGTEGCAPEKLCHMFPWVGHTVMRSGWDKDATWIFFEPGPRGAGHYDMARLNIQLRANGDWLLTDPGYFTYSAVGEEAEMGAYLKSTAGHNLVLVDGHGQLARSPGAAGLGPNTAPGDYGWTDTVQAVSASGAYTCGFTSAADPIYGVWDGQGVLVPVVHHRKVTYERTRDLVKITDTFEGEGRHCLDFHWQCAPHAKVSIEGSTATITMPHARLRLSLEASVKPQLSIHQEEKHPHRGWYSEGYGKLEPAPLLKVVMEAELPLQVVTHLKIYRSASEGAAQQHAIIGVGETSSRNTFIPNKHPDTQWFDQAFNLGLFVHWGISSVHGSTDLSWGYIKNTPWDRNSRVTSKTTPAEYYALANRFQPDCYEPRKWLAAAKAAGATYAVFTTKHHDGFTLWPTESSEIGTHTHLNGRDFVQPYVEVCRELGLKVGLYYSPPDWYLERKYISFEYESSKALGTHRRKPQGPKPAVQALGWHHERVILPEYPDDFDERFAARVRTQVEELLTRYGEIDLLWFDGRPYPLDTPGGITIERIRELQPGMLVNPRLFQSGDYETFEYRWPQTRPAGRWEHTDGLHNGGWGYHERAEFSSIESVVANIERARGWGGNYLANSGLGPNGDMPEGYYLLMEELRRSRG